MRGRISAWLLLLMKLGQYIENDEQLSRVIRELYRLEDCGPGRAIKELKDAVEAKLVTKMVEQPGFDMNKPDKHSLYLSGMIAGMRLLVDQAPAAAKETMKKLTE